MGSGVGANQQSQEVSDFIEVYTDIYLVFATIRDDIKTVEDIKGKVIGVQVGTYYYDKITEA